MFLQQASEMKDTTNPVIIICIKTLYFTRWIV